MPRITATVALLVLGDRIEKGAEVNVSDEYLKGLDPADYTLASDQPVVEPVEQSDETPFDEMTQAQLKARAKELGLKQSGSVADLQERITLHLSGQEEITND